MGFIQACCYSYLGRETILNPFHSRARVDLIHVVGAGRGRLVCYSASFAVAKLPAH